MMAQPTTEAPYPISDNVPDTPEDQPKPGKPLTSVGAFAVPEIVFGGATMSQIYNTSGWLASDMPFRTIRLALRYGIRCIDTSAYYGPSEIVIGSILRKLEPEFPRATYRLMTKCGREATGFDYRPQVIRNSVMRSLRRLNTTYLDIVLLHDVEFVASPVYPIPYSGDYKKALTDPTTRAEWGLDPDKAPRAWGRGDDTVMAAIRELQKMKEEGIVRAVGISGYPLPTLLRISRLVARTPGFQPLDCVLSFSHATVQNSRLELYLNPLLHSGGVKQIFSASPLSMGLLSPNKPTWHPAPPDMIEATRVAEAAAAPWPGGLPNLAISYSFRRPKSHAETSPYNDVPTIVGLSNLDEVHDAMEVWREVSIPGTNTVRKSKEDIIRSIFSASGWQNWSWATPANKDFDRLAVDMLGRKLRLS